MRPPVPSDLATGSTPVLPHGIETIHLLKMVDPVLEHALLERASHACELCGGDTALEAYEVASEEARDAVVVVCATCAPQLRGDAELDTNHWHCLQGSIWSEVPAVQVASWRLLHRLDEAWATELLEQAYLADDLLEWAREGMASAPTGPPTFDSNGAQLFDGDSVTLIKDLDVKGAGFTAKRGTMVRGIRTTDNPEHVEGKINGTTIVLVAEYLKRA